MSESTNLVARTLAVISALKGKTITGASVTELAKATRIPAPTITRILATMVAENFVIQLDSGRYAHSVRMLQIAQSHADEMMRTHDRLNELTQRIHAGAHN